MIREPIRVIFPATPNAIGLAEDIFEAVARNVTGDLRQSYRIRTALSEAYNNAFLYGQHAVEHPAIEFRMCFNGDIFSATIVNAGHGFAEKDIEWEMFPEVSAESGRGLKIMKKYCDRLTFKRGSDDKFEVHMEFEISTSTNKI